MSVKMLRKARANLGKANIAYVTQEQFDNAAMSLCAHVTGEQPGADFVKLENDHWFVMARIVLEGAGVRVP